ncbi:MAG: sel1 repeat family protein [Lentisphaerae bacterium]|nr:sel1 repeat family protein [Lentisphaerota bacterium]
MKLKRLSIFAALGLCCSIYAQDALLADALVSQGETKLKSAKTEDEFKEVFNLMTKAAEAGSQKGNLYLGQLYFEGKGTARDVKKAIECWELADKKSKEYPQGIAEAKYYLGLELFRRTTRTNDENSRMQDLLIKAGEMGCTEAWACLAKLYQDGNEFYPASREISKKYFLKAELQKPSAEYEYGIGCNYLVHDSLNKRDKISGVYWLKLAAGKGYLPAHAELGKFFLSEKEFDKANTHLEKAIPLKNLDAITSLNALRVFRFEKRYEKLSESAKKILHTWLVRARSGDQVAALTLGKYFLYRSSWQQGIKFDNGGHGFFFLQYAAGLGNKEAQQMINGRSVQALKEKKENAFTKWHKLNGDDLVKEFTDLYASPEFGKILRQPEFYTDFIQEFQQAMTPLGIFWLQDFTFLNFGEKEFSFCAAGVRFSTENKLEYYAFTLNKDNKFTLKYLGDNAKLLYGWIDAGYYMTAVKNTEGKIIVSGIACDDVTGTYPGNDDPKDNFYGKYGRAGFKPEQEAQVETFFPGLKKLLTEDKRTEIAELIKYPFLLNEGTPLEEKIATKEEFLARFNEIFTEEFKKELLATPDGEIFSSWMGAGVGKGLLWFVPGDKEQSGKILISKIGKHCFTMPDIFEK